MYKSNKNIWIFRCCYSHIKWR